jgi:multiple sugar transport system permease protein
MSKVSGFLKRTKILWSLAGVIITLAMLFPLYWVVVSSLETNTQIFHYPPYLFPPHPSLSAYASVLVTQLPHLGNSLIIAGGSTALSLVVAVPAAYALARFRFRWAGALLIALLISQMLPGVALANALFLIFTKIHLVNNYVGLMLTDCTFSIPFNVLILRAFLGHIPKDLTEAALVDGAGDWTAFFRVVLPLSFTGLITAGLFAFLFGWGDFLFAVTMISLPSMTPITVSLYDYVSSYSLVWNKLMATAVLASVPAAVLLVAIQRHIVAGITSGSVKG